MNRLFKKSCNCTDIDTRKIIEKNNRGETIKQQRKCV